MSLNHLGGCSHDYTKITVDSWARMTSARWNFVIKTTPNKEDCIVGTDCLNGIKKNKVTQGALEKQVRCLWKG